MQGNILIRPVIVLLAFVLHAICGAEAIDRLPQAAFTFAVLPDTQGYVSNKNEETFAAEIDWILEHQ